MKKQWIRRSMRKALTMITLTSTIALVSPMMIQTGTVAYAVAQDQAVVLADNTVGHLSYSYQADEQNIYWSLDVQEKISNESAYVRLKIDSVDMVSVAGQSFAKDESGWIDLDTLSLGTAVQQVAFSTLKTDDQTLAVTAELVVPGEGEVKDEIHPIVTGGKLEADVPLVTELPDVDPGITAEKEDTVEIPAPEQIEEDTLGDSEASPEEDASDTESSKQGMMSASPDTSVIQAANEKLEIGSRATADNIGRVSWNTFSGPNPTNIKREKSEDRHTTTGGNYSGTFYWRADSRSGNATRTYTYKIFKGNAVVSSGVLSSSTSSVQKVDFSIPSTSLSEGVNEFTVVAYLSERTQKPGGTTTEYELSTGRRATLTITIHPTYLSWDAIRNDNVVARVKDVDETTLPTSAYRANFNWKDLDGKSNISFKLFKNGKQIGNAVTPTGNSGAVSGQSFFDIQASNFNYGENEFVIKAYFNDVEVNPNNYLTLNYTIDAPTYMSWNSLAEGSSIVQSKTDDITSVPADGYSGRFYWSNLNGATGITFNIYKGSILIRQGLTASSGNPINFVIASQYLSSGKNSFTIHAMKDGNEISADSRLNLIVNVDHQTILTWDGTQTEKSDSREITTIGAYTTDFQWTDEDAGDLLKDALTFKVLNSNQASATEISGSAAEWTGSGKDFGKGSISIPDNQFTTHGNKVFYLQAYKNGTKTGSSIKLTITVNGSLKLISVPDELSWNGTLSDQEQILSRNEEMAVAVQDSRATGKGKGSFTLTMTSNEPKQNDFEFVWKGTAGSSAVTMENRTLGSNAFNNNNYTYTATYGTGAGILVKTNSNTTIQTTTRTITWTLNNTWTGS